MVGERGKRAVDRAATMPTTRFFPDAELSVSEPARAGADAR
jgi:hypothetical protein